MAVCPVMAATRGELESNSVSGCQKCILIRDKTRVGKYIHILATARCMIGSRRNRFDRGFPVNYHDVRPGLFCLSGKTGNLSWRYMGDLYTTKQPDAEQPGGFLYKLQGR